MAGRGRGGRGGRGSRGAAQGNSNEASPQLRIQSIANNEETQAQPTTPTSQIQISSAASCNTSKNVRGTYKCLTVDTKTKSGKIKVVIADDILRAVGEGSRDFVNYIGYVTRCIAPLKVREWTEIWEQCGSQILLKVKEKFDVGENLELRFDTFVNSTAQRSYRNWRSRLHKIYKQYNTDEARLENPPAELHDGDWRHLVKYFGSDDFKGQSSKNALNRTKQTTKHACGSRSFAEVEESTRNPETGKKASIDQIWELQHKRKGKDGEVIWSDAKSQEIHGQLQEIVANQSQEDNPSLTDNEILTQVLGQRTGYFRGKGYGIRPPTKRPTNQMTSQHLQEHKKKIREEVTAELREEMRVREERMKATLQETLHTQLQAQLEERLQSQMASLIASLQQGQLPSMATNTTSTAAPTMPNEAPS